MNEEVEPRERAKPLSCMPKGLPDLTLIHSTCTCSPQAHRHTATATTTITFTAITVTVTSIPILLTASSITRSLSSSSSSTMADLVGSSSEYTPKFAPFLGMGGIAFAMIFGCTDNV